ncbi:MAG: TNT domain-containing protein [Actinobacteria bacterium]|jgi:hypothetical protein|nr:TNT domain-containing protein [Actinomycetota bacterium]
MKSTTLFTGHGGDGNSNGNNTGNGHGHGGDGNSNGNGHGNDDGGNPKDTGNDGNSGNSGNGDGNSGGGSNVDHPNWKYDDPQVQDLKNTLEDAVQDKNLPGYDPTGGLGWERFMDEFFGGFDDGGRPRWNWPEDPPHTNGFTNGVSHSADLKPGDTIERITFIGANGIPLDGKFAAPPGTSFDQLSLPPDRLGNNTTVVRYEILKPLPDDIRMGDIAPGFGQVGHGAQYFFPRGIDWLIENGFLGVAK